MRQSSSAHAQEETRQTKNLPDPDGTGTGLSQHCAASVFSSQTIDLLFLGGTSPSQQTESGPVAIKGPQAHPPRIILLIIMSDIQRLTLISDPTNEFPKNANNIFKVRLPERLTLPGEGGHASLMSLTVPDQGQSNAVIATDPHTKVVTFSVTYLTRKYVTGEYRRVSFQTKEYTVELEDIMSTKHPVTSGNLFWKRTMQEVYNKTMRALMHEQDTAKTFDADERPLVSVKKNWMPMMTWKEDALILYAVPKGELMNGNKTKATSAFSLDMGVAEKFGFIEKHRGWANYTLGPNLQFTCPTVTFDGQTPPKDPSNRTDYYWEGEHYARTQPSDLNREVKDIMYQVKNKRLHLSRMVEWQFNNLNASYEKVVGTSKRTVMVYSDVVESSVVGSGKFPLLREVELLRTGEGRVRWNPCTTNGLRSEAINWRLWKWSLLVPVDPWPSYPLAKPW